MILKQNVRGWKMERPKFRLENVKDEAGN